MEGRTKFLGLKTSQGNDAETDPPLRWNECCVTDSDEHTHTAWNDFCSFG